MRTPVRLLAALLIIAGVESRAYGDIIHNGSFELPAIPADSYQVFGVSTAPGIPFWKVTVDDVDIDTANTFGDPFEGLQWLDLNGQSPGAIEQSFLTVIGAS